MIRSQTLPLLLALAVSLPAAAQTFVFELTGAQEVPPVSTAATGGCAGELNQPAATFSITCVHNVVNATVMHIHRGAVGVNGSVAFDMGNPASGVVTATWSGMTPADIADLLAGDLYMNIHTAGRPAGEIRGQIVPRNVDTVNFTATGAQVVPPGESSSTATCTANLNDPATALDIQCTHTVASPTSAHVHQAPAGSTGPVVYTFPSPASPLTGSVPMTQRLLADFAARFLYLDIHAGTSEEDADEIRGQIGAPPELASTGTVVIAKTTYPPGGMAFSFDETMTNDSFMINDGQTQTFLNVAAGAYTVTEGPDGDYTLGDVSCDDADSSGDHASRTATINLAAGETVRCTFRNFRALATDDIFVFHLSPDQEVPAVTGPERGGCMGRFHAPTSQLSLVCTHNVDLPTAIHVHQGAVGTNGPVVFDMGLPASPVFATWDMTPQNVADLFAENLYINIHTSGRPAGATRGQIVERTVDAVAFTLDAAQVVPPGTASATGNCTADLSTEADSLAIACTHNLASPAAAHVHEGERDENGPVVHTFSSPATPINENVPMTPRLVADYAGQLLYLDIHDSGTGESAQQIRGQIAPAVVAVTTGTIRITKSTVPAGGTNFGFTSNIPGGAAFTLNDTATQTFSAVPSGAYSVTETLPAGYSVSDVVCSDGDSSGNAFSRTASINLAAGETVTCTFTNVQTVANPTNFVFHLSGDQEVPPTSSTARGGCFGQLDPATAVFTLICTHNVVSPTQVHVHRAPAGQNGPVVFDLGHPNSPLEARWTMTPAEVTDLMAGNFYVNVHASGRPAGEIRGQIVPRSVDNFSFLVNAAQEVPPTDSTNTGNCTANLADNALSVLVQCTHTVPVVTDNHLHAGQPGQDGPAIFNFPNTSPFSGDVPHTPRLVADFAAGFLYVNIHSPNYDTGEIRGNLIGAEQSHLGEADIPTASEWGLIALGIALALLAMTRLRIS